ncbi:hypothetical protein M434DRAFT_397748 [Hypoxylon sp. CO27-5]|nr:hypothetical protein M434DRAFT_397748 [Hypoxylon sp. CO27-5]
MSPEVCNGSSARSCAGYVHFLFSPPRAGLNLTTLATEEKQFPTWVDISTKS